MKGFLVRSRANNIENGGKPSQFFCSLETNNFTSKVINVIENDEGEIITDQKQILEETRKYYETLYANKENTLNDVDLNIHMEDMNVQKLNEEEIRRTFDTKRSRKNSKKYEK